MSYMAISRRGLGRHQKSVEQRRRCRQAKLVASIPKVLKVWLSPNISASTLFIRRISLGVCHHTPYTPVSALTFPGQLSAMLPFMFRTPFGAKQWGRLTIRPLTANITNPRGRQK